MSITPAELARRRPVWMALSEFYLDTELGAEELHGIRRTLAASGYSEQEVAAINYDEVAPVLLANTWSTAGVWAGFDEAWLVDTIQQRLCKKADRFRIPGLRWLFRKQVDFHTKAYFKHIFSL